MTRKRSVTLLYDVVEDEEQQAGEDEPVYRQVARALRTKEHEVSTLAATSDIKALIGALERDESEIVFNLCESLGGEDSHATNVASLLELLGKRFTGAGSLGLTLAQDKALSKKLFAFHGLSSPRFSVMQAGQVEWSDDLQFPLFVKPSGTDSSVGIDEGSLVRNLKELMERISYIQTELKSPVLIEEFIDGRELFLSVIEADGGHRALPIVEWDFSACKGPKFATQEAKWNKASEGYKAPERFPHDIPEPVYKAMQDAAIDACKALRIFDYGRVDMRARCSPELPKDDPNSWKFYIIEVNPNPYLEENAEIAMSAREGGLQYVELLEKILESAERRALGL
jgi:D-alanine-D-alanine ligase